MSIETLTIDNLNDTIENNDIVLIDFWAPWCGPCQTFKPVYEEAADRHPDVTFTSCNTEEDPQLAAMFQVRSIPTLIAFREKIMVFAQPGMLPGQALDELIGKMKELDMDEVRAKVAEQEANAASG